MKKSDSISKLAVALVEATKDLKNIEKDMTAGSGSYSYKYASLAQILKETRPVLCKNGLAVIQSASISERGKQSVETMLVHSSGEWVSTETEVLTPESRNPQDSGKAITYARRYGISAILNLSSEDDDDCQQKKVVELNLADIQKEIDGKNSDADLKKYYLELASEGIAEAQKTEVTAMFAERKKILEGGLEGGNG